MNKEFHTFKNVDNLTLSTHDIVIGGSLDGDAMTAAMEVATENVMPMIVTNDYYDATSSLSVSPRPCSPAQLMDDDMSALIDNDHNNNNNCNDCNPSLMIRVDSRTFFVDDDRKMAVSPGGVMMSPCDDDLLDGELSLAACHQQVNKAIGSVDGYYKDVHGFEHMFAKYGARFVPSTMPLEELIKSVIRENDSAEEPFYLMDLSRVVRQYTQWKQHLPRVRPFYAVKCNDSPIMVQLLDYLGASFDCASRGEIDLVMRNANYLAPNRPPMDPSKRIIFANPCKQISHCRYAHTTGVEMTTADNEYELRKIKTYWPNAKVVLRIKTDDSKSVCQFSTKFGVSVESGDAERLVELCRDLDLCLYGVSFHVGSGCQSAESFVDAVKNARRLFDIASTYGFTMKLLDIGGGFPGSDGTANVDFVDVATVLSPVLDALFDDSVDIIGEPGRYFAQAPYTLVCNVFAKREATKKHTEEEEGKPAQPDVLYYINDGIYSSFNCIIFDHVKVTLNHLPASAVFGNDEQNYENAAPQRLSTVFGPTCDSIDKIIDCEPMPDMEPGDYVYCPLFGSYTMAAGSSFNGFKTTKFFYYYTN